MCMKCTCFSSLLAGIMLLFAACEGPEGPIGPPGPPGPPGLDGNANVFSINYVIIADDWVDDGQPGDPEFFRFLDLSVPEITQDIVDNGLVLVYYRVDENERWNILPFTIINHDPPFTQVFDFTYDPGFVTLYVKATDRDGDLFEGDVRVIVAEGIPITKTEIDFSNYEEVKALFGLKD